MQSSSTLSGKEACSPVYIGQSVLRFHAGHTLRSQMAA